MQRPLTAAEARAACQKTLLQVCKSAAQEEAAVICAALAAVKGLSAVSCAVFTRQTCLLMSLVSETLLVTSVVLTDAAKKSQAEYIHFLASGNPADDLNTALDIIMFKEAALVEASTLLELSSFAFEHDSMPCLMHHMVAVVSSDNATIKSICSSPPAVIIMRTRPDFAPIPSILELCEALALAAAHCAGMCAWTAAQAMAMSCIAWAWAVQVEDLRANMRTSFENLLQSMLVMLCQCNLHQLASSPPFVAWSKEAAVAVTRGDHAQLKHLHHEFSSHALHVQASDSHLPHAALAIQAVLLLADGTSDAGGNATRSSLAAAAVLKTFNVVAAAPLTHPLPNDWDFSETRDDDLGVAEPIHLLVRALMSKDHTCITTALLKAASIRCGSASPPSVDDSATWWCSSPSLMRGGDNAPPSERHHSKSLSVHSSHSSAPRLRYTCVLSHLPGFVWPSHHYSVVLESWACFGTRLSTVEQRPVVRSCPLTSLFVGIQPALLAWTANTAAQMKELAATPNGLMPHVAFLVVSVHQPFCTALQLVLAPIVSIGSAIPFATALRLQSAEATKALVACQRAHMVLLGAPGSHFLEKLLEIESLALSEYIALGSKIDREFEELLQKLHSVSDNGQARASSLAGVGRVGCSADLWRLLSVMRPIAVAGLVDKGHCRISDTLSLAEWELSPRDLNEDVGIVHHAILRLAHDANQVFGNGREVFGADVESGSSDISYAMKRLFSSVCRRLVPESPQLKSDVQLLQMRIRLCRRD